MSLQSIKRQRENRADETGTPPAIFLNTGDIDVDTNDGGWVLDFTEESTTRKYSPYPNITINNSSSSGLNVYVNQNRAWKKICRANSELSISEFKGIRGVRISKRDAAVTIAAGEIEVNVERIPLSDDEYRRRQQNVPLIMRMARNFLGV